MTLTSKQRAFLNSQAHSLKPIIQIGKNGLNDQIKTSVRQALDARELIKVTLLQNSVWKRSKRLVGFSSCSNNRVKKKIVKFQRR